MKRDPDPRDVIATLDAAHAYAARGWSVIPFEARGKRPGLAWLEFQKRRASQQEVESWFRHRRDANVGVVTGAISGIVVIDVDAGHDGIESLKRLEVEHGPLPSTVEAITGRASSARCSRAASAAAAGGGVTSSTGSRSSSASPPVSGRRRRSAISASFTAIRRSQAQNGASSLPAPRPRKSPIRSNAFSMVSCSTSAASSRSPHTRSASVNTGRSNQR